jgi:hypothetical protein
MSKFFMVKARVSGTIDVEVEAESEAEAKSKAEDRVNCLVADDVAEACGVFTVSLTTRMVDTSVIMGPQDDTFF